MLPGGIMHRNGYDDRGPACEGAAHAHVTCQKTPNLAKSREEGRRAKARRPRREGSATREGYFPFFGFLLMVSTVAVLFRAVAAFTDMKRPFFAFRPIFLPLDMHITPFPGRVGPALRRAPAGGVTRCQTKLTG